MRDIRNTNSSYDVKHFSAVEVSSYYNYRSSVFDYMEDEVSNIKYFQYISQRGQYIACTELSSNGWDSGQV